MPVGITRGIIIRHVAEMFVQEFFQSESGSILNVRSLLKHTLQWVYTRTLRFRMIIFDPSASGGGRLAESDN